MNSWKERMRSLLEAEAKLEIMEATLPFDYNDWERFKHNEYDEVTDEKVEDTIQELIEAYSSPTGFLQK